MLKTYRKLLVVALLFCIACSSLAAYGMFQVGSNIVHVDIQFAVALNVKVSRTRVSLAATVTNNGNPVGAGIDVEFYYSLDGGDWILFATQSTNSRGVTGTMFLLTSDGEYEFKAITSFQR
jgi:hypothetical protein